MNPHSVSEPILRPAPVDASRLLRRALAAGFAMSALLLQTSVSHAQAPGATGQPAEQATWVDGEAPADATLSLAVTEESRVADSPGARLPATSESLDAEERNEIEATELEEATAEEEEGPPAINPRPAGEAELLGKHAISSTKNTYKPGTGAVLDSEDGLFSLAIRARVQIRDEVDVVGEQVENRFGIRRARLQLKGHMFGEHNKFKAEFAFSPSDLGYQNGTIARTPLLTYYVEFDHLRDLSIRLGQYKLYFNRQRVISSGNLEMVDRTTAQNQFNLDRDVGFHFYSEDFGGWDFLKYYAGVTLGQGRDVWLANSLSTGGDSAAQFLGRIELLPFGHFKDYSEVDFERLNQFRLSIGAAYAYLDNGAQRQGYRGVAFADGGRVDYHNVNLDLFMKWAGLTGLVEAYLRAGWRDVVVADGDTDNLPANGVGASVQLGYLLPRLPIGVAARYSGTGIGWLEADRTALRSDHEVGGAVSWYMAGHPLKLQADYFHQWGDVFAGAEVDRVQVQLQVAY